MSRQRPAHARLAPAALAGALVVALLAAVPARAHGNSTPVSRQVLVTDTATLVSAGSYGLFRGDAAGWSWICPEAIGKNPFPRFTRTGVGTLFATDYAGLTRSRDGGCTWTPNGPLEAAAISDVAADPAHPARVFVTTDTGLSAAANGLYVSDDDGDSWEALFEADEFLEGVAVSPDGQRIAVIGVPRGDEGPQGPVLHLSVDGGRSFAASPVDFELADCPPGSFLPAAFDPANPDELYFTATVSPLCNGDGAQPGWALVRHDAGDGSWHTAFTSWTTIESVAFEPRTGAMYLSTWGGMMRAPDHRHFERVPQLTSTQCVLAAGDDLYACTWDERPRMPALERSRDGGENFESVFRFADTSGPTASCAPGTPVALLCPGAWPSYAARIREEPAASPTPVKDSGCTSAPAGLLALLGLAARRRKRVG